MSNKHVWLSLIVNNSVCITCWTALAIVFNHWWIALFAIFFICVKTKKSNHRFICDYCGRYSPSGSSPDEAEQRRIEAGWRRRKNNDKWEDICPECQAEMERGRQELQKFFREKYTLYYEEKH